MIAHSKGQPDNIRANLVVAPFNDLEVLSATLAEHGKEIAAIVLEPVMCNSGVIEPRPGYLQGMRKLCDEHGIVLIFDEVITGFRVALGGAQERYGVTPDLAVFAKACAAGFPMAIIAGKRAVMEEVMAGVVHGGTYNGLTSTVAACRASIETLAADGGAIYDRIDRQGQRLMAGLREIGKRRQVPLHTQGLGQTFTTVFTDKGPLSHYRDYKATDEPMRLKFVQGMQDRGVRITARGTWFMSAVLDEEDIDATLEAADGAAGDL